MAKSISAYEQFSRLLPRADAVDAGWLKKFLPTQLQSRRPLGRQTSRLLTRMLEKTHGLTVPSKLDIAAHERWLLLTISDQRKLALCLGCQACSNFIRTIVAKPQVNTLLRVVGEEQYSRLLNQSELVVDQILRKDFESALADDNIDCYFLGVGVALLELTLDRDERFFNMRMRFSFPPACWAMRPTSITTDIDKLRSLVVDLTGELQAEEGAPQYG